MRRLSFVLTICLALGCTHHDAVPTNVADEVTLETAVRRVAPVGGRVDSAERALEGDGFTCIREEFGPSLTRCARTATVSFSGKEREWVVELLINDGRVGRLQAAVRDIRR